MHHHPDRHCLLPGWLPAALLVAALLLAAAAAQRRQQVAVMCSWRRASSRTIGRLVRAAAHSTECGTAYMMSS